MRAGTSTDDYLIIDDEWWTVVDTSPNRCAFCGICTGMALYGPSWREDHISFNSYLKLEGDRLLIDDSHKTRRFTPDWLSKYLRFVDGQDVGNEVAYSGWILVYKDARFAGNLEDLMFASGAMELRFSEGGLVEIVDLSPVHEILEDAYPGDYSHRDLWMDEEEPQKAIALISGLLKGEYNSTARDDHKVGKDLRWGYRDGEGGYECATCSKLQRLGIAPIKPPKHPRKKKYRHIDYQLPRYYPQWVRDLLEQQMREQSEDTNEARIIPTEI